MIKDVKKREELKLDKSTEQEIKQRGLHVEACV